MAGMAGMALYMSVVLPELKFKKRIVRR